MMTTMFFDVTSPNYSLFALPIMYILTLIPHWYAVSICIARDGWKNEHPRTFVTQLAARPILGTKKMEHTPAERKILRAEACQQNGFENLPIFGMALLCGLVAELPGYLMNAMAALYLLSRIIYTILYIFVDSYAMSLLRSFTFLGQVTLYMAFFMQAAFAVASRSQTQRWGF